MDFQLKFDALHQKIQISLSFLILFIKKWKNKKNIGFSTEISCTILDIGWKTITNEKNKRKILEFQRKYDAVHRISIESDAFSTELWCTTSDFHWKFIIFSGINHPHSIRKCKNHGFPTGIQHTVSNSSWTSKILLFLVEKWNKISKIEKK